MDIQNLLKRSWNNFKTQPEIWFFFGFLVTSILSIRKVVFFYPQQDQFNEYAGTYIYLSDIVFVLLVISWGLSILNNKSCNLSISTVRDGMRKLKCSTWNIYKLNLGIIAPLVALLAWSFISIVWSVNPEIALYRSLKLFEMVILFLFVAFNSKCSTWNNLRRMFQIVMALGAINALIGLWQVILQKSIGFFWLKESLISPAIPGIAKLLFHGQRYIRAYGLFPHPNILGGFLLLSIMFTLAYWKLFHPSRIVPRGTIYGAGVEQFGKKDCDKCSTWNILGIMISAIVPRGTILRLILAIQIVGIILSGSKSALIGLILALGYVLVRVNVPRGTFVEALTYQIKKIKCSTWNILRNKIPGIASPDKMFHLSRIVSRETIYGAGMEQSTIRNSRKYLLLALVGAFSLFLVYISSLDVYSWLFKSLAERLTYLRIALEVIINKPLFGLGMGQFVPAMQLYTNQMLFDWQLQPVHNVFLLIWVELGLVGLSLFGWLIWKLFRPSRIVPRGTIYGAGVEQFRNDWEIENVPRGTFCGADSGKMEDVEESKCSTWNIFADDEDVPGDNLGDKNVPRGTKCDTKKIMIVFKGLLLGFLFIALFDHYLWDIQQGQIMLWITLGLVGGQARVILTK